MLEIVLYYGKRMIPFAALYFILCCFTFVYKAFSCVGALDASLYSWIKMCLNFSIQSGVVFLYAMLPFTFYLAVLPRCLHGAKVDRRLTAAYFFFFTFIALFTKTAEGFFWNEFGASFNFIAVDYLVYTQELIRNIWESYPVAEILFALFVVAALLTALFYRCLKAWGSLYPMTPVWHERLRVSLFFAVSCAAFSLFFDGSFADGVSDNRYNQEIAKNEIFSFCSAFFNNNLDYESFYITQPERDNLSFLRNAYQRDGVVFKDETSLWRRIDGGGEEKRKNVVLVVMESMGSEFMNEENSTDGENLTPQLSRLAREGLYFPNVYATGTRTVRGLEAVTLALPPQAGMSVIRQKKNENLANIGSIFKEKGYDVKWLYGGYGYFDNMNAFYGGNGFTVVDRTDIADEAVHHATVWGVADEDLYTKALQEASVSYEQGKPFFYLLMTTSNHRPYTYPEGRIDLSPKVSGRRGAVKYADWAVGDFIERARVQPWFRDTVFVFIADHGAGSAGKSELNPKSHRIPLIFYAPGEIQPQRVEKIISQIDAMPTLLGLLRFSYDCPFMGRDALLAPDDGRYFISNYQYIGYGKDDEILTLKPVRDFSYKKHGWETSPPNDGLLYEAVAYYQYAANWRQILTSDGNSSFHF